MEEYSELKDLLKYWNIMAVESVKKIYYTATVFLVTTAINEKYILKVKRNINTLEQEYKLLSALKACGIPVGVPLLNNHGNICIWQENKCYCLYPYMPGGAIIHYFTKGTEERAKCFGTSIGRLHKALKQCSGIDGFAVLNLFDEILPDSLNKICEHSCEHVINKTRLILKELNAELAPLYEKLPQQLIHMDMHPSNMLFDKNNTLQGIIDFESVVEGIRIFDLCYCCAYILISGYRDESKRQKSLDLMKFIVKGYNSINPLTKHEKIAFRYILMSALFFFIAAFYKVYNMDIAVKTQEALFWVYDNRSMIGKIAFST